MALQIVFRCSSTFSLTVVKISPLSIRKFENISDRFVHSQELDYKKF